MSRDPISHELRGLDNWLTREPPMDGDAPERHDDGPGVITAICQAIDDYCAMEKEATLDLSNVSGWHRNFLAMHIAAALEQAGHVAPEDDELPLAKDVGRG